MLSIASVASFWDAVNNYVTACGGNPKVVHPEGSDEQQACVQARAVLGNVVLDIDGAAARRGMCGDAAFLPPETPFIEVGDVVRLKSGGPKMTVQHKTITAVAKKQVLTEFLCVWLDARQHLRQETFFATSLQQLQKEG